MRRRHGAYGVQTMAADDPADARGGAPAPPAGRSGPVLRVVLLQAGAALAAGAGFWFWKGDAAGLAGLAGGLIVATGSALFGWWMFRPGIAAAPRLASAMFGAVGLKWLWFVLALFYALARLKLAPGPLLAGMVIAQVGLWGAMARPR